MTPPLEVGNNSIVARETPEPLTQEKGGSGKPTVDAGSDAAADQIRGFLRRDTASPYLPTVQMNDYFGLSGETGLGELGDWKNMAGIAAGAESDAEAEIKAEVKSGDGKRVFRRSADGTYQCETGNGNAGIAGFDPEKQKITDVEAEGDADLKLTLSDGSIIRSRADGSSLVYPDESAFKSNHPATVHRKGKKSFDINWDEGNENRIKDISLNQHFYQVKDDMWSTDPKSRTGWHGRMEFDGRTGELRITPLSGKDANVTTVSRPDGRTETLKPDGSMSMELQFEGEESNRRFEFASGFPPAGGTLKPQKMTVDADGSKSEYRLRADGKYELDGKVVDADIQVERDSEGLYSYSFVDHASGFEKHCRDGFVSVEDPTNQLSTIKQDGRYESVSEAGSDYRFAYDSQGELESFEDHGANRLWTRDESGAFKDAPLDATRPYESPGTIEAAIVGNSDLDGLQKSRMLRDARTVTGREDLPESEKEEFFAQAQRLLDTPPASKMTAKQRADLAEQLLWHAARPDRNEQGRHSTCNVTTVRGMFLYDKPSVVGKVVADVSETGAIKTQDGSTIRPPMSSLLPREGSSEAKFPPQPGQRTWLGQIWDVTAVNTYYQRQTTDPTGQRVAKGSLYFKQEAPDGGSDHGERICKQVNGTEYVLGKRMNGNGAVSNFDGPSMYEDRFLDVYHQLSGEIPSGRMLAHKDKYVGDRSRFKALGGVSIDSEGDLEKTLAGAHFPVIVKLNTGLTELRKREQDHLDRGEDRSGATRPAGGEHVLLVTGYDPQSKTVSVDNSWSPVYDFRSRAELASAGVDANSKVAMTVGDLYSSMKDTTAGESFNWIWRHR
ncbi:MAG: hypothetical protein AB7W16_27840 [Candidatus Obscuribacterales bacterium]